MAALVGGIAESVGLQLLLQPSSSSVILRAACTAVGVAYPAYQTVKLLEAPSIDRPLVEDDCEYDKEVRRWLSYWAVYGTVETLERYASGIIKWLPFYWHLKLGFLLWLQLPSLQGAWRLVMRLRPTLQRHQQSIDATLHALHDSLIRPEFVKVAAAVRSSLHAVPLAEWLLRTPQEDEDALQREEQLSISRYVMSNRDDVGGLDLQPGQNTLQVPRDNHYTSSANSHGSESHVSNGYVDLGGQDSNQCSVQATRLGLGLSPYSSLQGGSDRQTVSQLDKQSDRQSNSGSRSKRRRNANGDQAFAAAGQSGPKAPFNRQH